MLLREFVICMDQLRSKFGQKAYDPLTSDFLYEEIGMIDFETFKATVKNLILRENHNKPPMLDRFLEILNPKLEEIRKKQRAKILKDAGNCNLCGNDGHVSLSTPYGFADEIMQCSCKLGKDWSAFPLYCHVYHHRIISKIALESKPILTPKSEIKIAKKADFEEMGNLDFSSFLPNETNKDD